MSAASATGDLLTARQIADLLTVSLRTFNRMVAAGEFPRPLRRNRKWVRWTRGDLEAYLSGLESGRRPAPVRIILHPGCSAADGPHSRLPAAPPPASV